MPIQPASMPGLAVPPVNLPWLVSRLGTQTQIGMDGIVRFNEALTRQLAAQREQAIPVLAGVLANTQSIPALLEGLYTADLMADMGVRGLDRLYPAVSRWNANPDPLVQIYLAGFYRKINTPTSFGPMLATLVHHAVNNYPAQASPTHNLTEEVGGAVLQQLAETTANITVQKLMPYFVNQKVPAR